MTSKSMNGAVRQNGSAMPCKRQSIIVTGGAGFLGSQLCKALVGQGHRVLSVDNLLSGRMDNIADLTGEPNFAFRWHDVVQPLAVTGPVDEIYNLACVASPPAYQSDPIHTFKTSVLGAINMLELAQAKGARILQASTSEVYGDPDISPQSEGYFGNVNSYGPRSCYDEGKRAAETLFHDFNERKGVATRIARIFNTYGPNMRPDDGRVVSNFATQAVQGEDLTIYGDGSQTRSFCYVDDMIDGLIRLMAAPDGLSRPINLGNPEEFTVRALARKILAFTGARSRIVFRDLPVDDPHQRRPDITTARAFLSWHPTISLTQGLARTIPYFETELKRTGTFRTEEPKWPRPASLLQVVPAT